MVKTVWGGESVLARPLPADLAVVGEESYLFYFLSEAFVKRKRKKPSGRCGGVRVGT